MLYISPIPKRTYRNNLVIDSVLVSVIIIRPQKKEPHKRIYAAAWDFIDYLVKQAIVSDMDLPRLKMTKTMVFVTVL